MYAFRRLTCLPGTTTAPKANDDEREDTAAAAAAAASRRSMAAARGDVNVLGGALEVRVEIEGGEEEGREHMCVPPCLRLRMGMDASAPPSFCLCCLINRLTTHMHAHKHPDLWDGPHDGIHQGRVLHHGTAGFWEPHGACVG